MDSQIKVWGLQPHYKTVCASEEWAGGPRVFPTSHATTPLFSSEVREGAAAPQHGRALGGIGGRAPGGDAPRLRRLPGSRLAPPSSCPLVCAPTRHSPGHPAQRPHWNYVDCVRWLGDCVLSKSVDDTIVVGWLA